MDKLTREQKKEWAKMLFLKEGLTQKEIAQKVEVSEVTLSKWASIGKWDVLKTATIATKSEQLARLYMQLGELNEAVMKRPEGKRFMDNREADTLIKVTAAIRHLEVETGLSDIVSVTCGFLDWIRKNDLEKAKEYSNVFDLYIREKMASL